MSSAVLAFGLGTLFGACLGIRLTIAWYEGGKG
jgi:hypothetical protein